MNEKDWTTEDRPEPWEQSFYQTGSTCPPKSRSGIVAFLLAAVIFLGGIVSALGLLNIRLFRQINDDSQDEDASVGFSLDATTGETAESTQTEASGDSLPMNSDDVNLQLSTTPEAVENIPQEGGLSLQAIYTKAIDSVVSISCTSDAGSSTGTGVVLSRDGYIVTNCHVVEGATQIQVLFTDQRIMTATLVGKDSISDLAVLYVSSSELTPAEFGDSSNLRVGDTVVAIGDPLGVELRGTMTDGIVSAINRDITTDGRTMTLIQTNAALNSGNSGGPLLNCYGQVIGINTMKIGDYMSSAGVEGLGFAIPSTTVKEVVDQLVQQGYVSGRPTIGITGQDISSFDQLYYRLPQGIYITQVDASSDAAAKGITPGDILLQFDGVRITDSNSLKNALYSHNAGDTVTVVIYRSGTQYSVEITLDEAQ